MDGAPHESDDLALIQGHVDFYLLVRFGKVDVLSMVRELRRNTLFFLHLPQTLKAPKLRKAIIRELEHERFQLAVFPDFVNKTFDLAITFYKKEQRDLAVQRLNAARIDVGKKAFLLDPLLDQALPDHRMKSVLDSLSILLQEQAQNPPPCAEWGKFSAKDINVRPAALPLKHVPAALEKELARQFQRQQEVIARISAENAGDGSGVWELKHGNRFEFFKTRSEEHLVGKGSEGVVYYARERSNHSKNMFACKEILDPNAAVTKEYEALRLLQERGKSRRLVRHEEYVLPEKFERNGYLFLELAVTDLEKLVVGLGSALDADVTSFLLRRLTKPLSDVHEGGHVHRDVRPPNILIFRQGEIKLSDFGFARPFNTLLSRTALRADNLQPFEVCSLGPNDPVPKLPKSDVFQLGMTFCFVATRGQYPFGNHSHVEQQRLIIQRAAPSVTWLAKTLSDPFLEHLLIGMLHHDVGKRYSLENVMNHPYFWDHNRREDFIRRLWETKQTDAQVELAYEKHLKEWSTAIPFVARLLEPGKVARSSFQGLVACIRHGFTHSAEWREGQASRGTPEEQKLAAAFMMQSKKWKTLNEFWFRHPAVAWLIPACYESLVEQERRTDMMRQLVGCAVSDLESDSE